MKSNTLILLCSSLLAGVVAPFSLSANDSSDLPEPVSNWTEAEVQARLDTIIVEDFRLTHLPISKAVGHLDSVVEAHGVQILFRGIEGKDPEINLKTRNLSIARNLSFMCQQAGYTWSVDAGVVVVSGEGHGEALQTELLPVSHPTVRRLIAAGIL